MQNRNSKSSISNDKPSAHGKKTTVVVDTSTSRMAHLKSILLDSVRWTAGYWADRYQQTCDVTVRRLWELLADPDAGHVLDNLRIAAGLQRRKYADTNWQDAWSYKWIEAAACIYRMTGDKWLDERMDEAIDIIGRAQEQDGYIASQITAQGKKRFQNPREHEVFPRTYRCHLSLPPICPLEFGCFRVKEYTDGKPRGKIIFIAVYSQVLWNQFRSD